MDQLISTKLYSQLQTEEPVFLRLFIAIYIDHIRIF